MALSKAIQFLGDAISSKELRDKCAEFKTRREMLKWLDFNDVEFEDAINMQLVKCRSADDAEFFHQLRMWFKLL
ncbi:hypothetical protein ACE1ET_14965 [Saccharicrinis sp. FJH62]|uniref:hypothetical protein n=1 Tax=Saccharicrinis sp. FJH62 TaxID=3344657 RepID=UPI0035D42F68